MSTANMARWVHTHSIPLRPRGGASRIPVLCVVDEAEGASRYPPARSHLLLRLATTRTFRGGAALSDGSARPPEPFPPPNPSRVAATVQQLRNLSSLLPGQE
jgi:hypothetical protein